MFKQYGLGVKTNIDLPVESLGLEGNKVDSGLLLDLSIGQYDTYTPVMLGSYISTIATSGKRYQLHFLKEIRNPSNDEKIGTLKQKIEPKLINEVDLDPKYMDRIRLGFSKVMNSTGYDYMGDVIDPSGKTGTAETFKDTDDDGLIDKETMSKGFIGYAPKDNPKFSMVILSPNVKYSKTSDYTSPVNYKISKRVANKVFEILK
jgi:cell division protein FtsI/penicillin-binding protein 2